MRRRAAQAATVTAALVAAATVRSGRARRAGRPDDRIAGLMAADPASLARHDRRRAVDALRAVPVLALAGTEDATIPAASARRLAEQIGEQARLDWWTAPATWSTPPTPMP